MEFLVSVLLGLLLCRSTVAQRAFFPLDPLPTLSASSAGSFIIPNTGGNQYYVQGSEMNVSWTSRYPSNNLFIVFNDDFANPRQLMTGTTASWYSWTIDDYGNNSHYFRFAIRNAVGDVNDGPNSGAFWISDQALVDAFDKTKAGAAPTVPTASTSVPATTSSIKTTSTPSTTSTATTSSAQTSSAATIPTSTHGANTTALSSSETTSNTSTTPASVLMATTTATTTALPAAPSGQNNNIALAAGIGIGSGVFLIAVAVGLMLFFSRRRKAITNEKTDAASETSYPSASELEPRPPRYMRDPGHEVSGTSAYVEAPGHQNDVKEAPANVYYAEVPGNSRRPPQELPGNDWQQPSAGGRNVPWDTSRNESWRTKPHPPMPMF